MAPRISPFLWPVLASISPLLAPILAVKSAAFFKGREKAESENLKRMEKVNTLDLPEVSSLELKVVVEQKHLDGFLGDSGVSYVLKTPKGSMLMDVGYGLETEVFTQNWKRLGVSGDQLDSLLISHLHLDHMGGMRAQKDGKVYIPDELSRPEKECYLPVPAITEGMKQNVISGPEVLGNGMATTGPLARMMFFLGWCEEQAVVVNVKGKGLVVLTGCGHPTIEVILRMVQRMSDEPVYAIAGGLHFPITESRFEKMGIQMQRLFGTGKPFWDPIDDEDLTRTIAAIKEAGPVKLYLSGHDTCDHALARLQNETGAEAQILHAGETYKI